MIVKTRNSTYEIEGDKIRSLFSRTDKNTGITSKWRKFSAKIGPIVGESMHIFWPETDFGIETTTTSYVVDIENDEAELGGWVK